MKKLASILALTAAVLFAGCTLAPAAQNEVIIKPIWQNEAIAIGTNYSSSISMDSLKPDGIMPWSVQVTVTNAGGVTVTYQQSNDGLTWSPGPAGIVTNLYMTNSAAGDVVAMAHIAPPVSALIRFKAVAVVTSINLTASAAFK